MQLNARALLPGDSPEDKRRMQTVSAQVAIEN